uniref:Uncharacterized protein n=1 Tax=Arundo donax TaxID=35708 RepID=A0A0A9D0H7_ARUDO
MHSAAAAQSTRSGLHRPTAARPCFPRSASESRGTTRDEAEWG